MTGGFGADLTVCRLPEQIFCSLAPGLTVVDVEGPLARIEGDVAEGVQVFLFLTPGVIFFESGDVTLLCSGVAAGGEGDQLLRFWSMEPELVNEAILGDAVQLLLCWSPSLELALGDTKDEILVRGEKLRACVQVLLCAADEIETKEDLWLVSDSVLYAGGKSSVEPYRVAKCCGCVSPFSSRRSTCTP